MTERSRRSDAGKALAYLRQKLCSADTVYRGNELAFVAEALRELHALEQLIASVRPPPQSVPQEDRGSEATSENGAT